MSSSVTQDPAPLGGRVVRLLLVDDDPQVRDSLSRLLRRMGAHVTLATDARAANLLLDSCTFDLVICDYDMPGGDGMQVAEEWIRQGRRPSRFVLHSGRRLPVLHVRVLSKPADPETFRALLEEVGQR